jgi:serine/threonine-protein kinase RsbW
MLAGAERGRVRRSVVLDEPSAGQAREAVVAAATETRLTRRAVEGLELGVSEVVANALQHGAPPVRVVILTGPDRVEVRVSDGGPGPDHLDVAATSGDTAPVPADATGGRGLWLAHRNCDEVAVTADGTGCTVRLLARAAN